MNRERGAAEHFANTSPEELRARRTAALAEAEEAEELADDAKRQARMYSKAAHEFEQKAFRATAEASAAEAAGHEAEANGLRESIEYLRKLIQQNYAKADEKAGIAVALEREATKEMDLAARLKDELNERTRT